MKSKIKQGLKLLNKECLNIYLRLFYKYQLRYKLLKKSDLIDYDYKKRIINYWSQFNVNITTDWHKFYSSRNGLKDVRYSRRYLL